MVNLQIRLRYNMQCVQDVYTWNTYIKIQSMYSILYVYTQLMYYISTYSLCLQYTEL